MKLELAGRSPAEMPFLDHLEELRQRILWSLAAVVAGPTILEWACGRFSRPQQGSARRIDGPADGTQRDNQQRNRCREP